MNRRDGALPASAPPRSLFPAIGSVISSIGLKLVIDGVPGALGDLVYLAPPTGNTPSTWAEIVGFQHPSQALCMLLTPMGRLSPDHLVIGTGHPITVPTGARTLGRMMNGLGMPIDGGFPIAGVQVPITAPPIAPLRRRPITTVFHTGVRIIDGLFTLGVGQRCGIFAGAGVGKTTLLQQILANAQYDVAVVALIGERGREVSEFWTTLTPAARRHTITIVATSDQPPLLRLRTLATANRLAESWRDTGAHVLLVVDSLTRAAHAAREVGLTTGELPTARGYPPSFFATLPQWFERAGAMQDGAITGLYTVLLDADDTAEPVADAVRGLIDGGLYLDRTLAERHHFPAIHPLQSLSRLQPDLITPAQWALVGAIRHALARVAETADLVSLGAYHAGTDPDLDQALAFQAVFGPWAQQATAEATDPATVWTSLYAIAAPYWPALVQAAQEEA